LKKKEEIWINGIQAETTRFAAVLLNICANRHHFCIYFTTKNTKGTKERKKNLLQGSILIHFMDYFLLIFNFLFLIFLNFLRVLRALRGLNFKMGNRSFVSRYETGTPGPAAKTPGTAAKTSRYTGEILCFRLKFQTPRLKLQALRLKLRGVN